MAILGSSGGELTVNGNTIEQINGVGAKAWVNFNGTGTVAIREDFNISSITDVAVGKYNVNFATAMTDSNYAVSGGNAWNTTGGGGFIFTIDGTDGMLTTALAVEITNHSGASVDPITCTMCVFR